MKGKKTVLVADDEPVLRELLSMFLREHHLLVREAANGQEAFDIFQHEKIDLIITDVQMPGMTGIELLVSAKQFAPNIPVIIMTSGEQKEEQWRQMGAASVLRKPLCKDFFLAVEQASAI